MMQKVLDVRGSSGRQWRAIGAAGLLAMALVSGCAEADSGPPATTTDAVSTTGDDAGNVLTVRPVASSGLTGQGQADCQASATHAGALDEPLVVCDAGGREVFYLEPAIITDSGVASVQSQQNPQSGSYVVMMEFTPDAAQEVQAFASEHEGTALAFVVDGTVLSAPVIRDAVQGQIMINGDFSESEAQALVDRLT